MRAAAKPSAAVPALTLWGVFRKFLFFGVNAWGGPVAQIALIKQRLVEEERWITPERFNRVLGVYQALPGPEAHELCCYFGYLARGRLGAVLAGLGFMLPGFCLVLGAALLYQSFGGAPLMFAAFAAMQSAVCALIFRAVGRLGSELRRSRTQLQAFLAALCWQAAGLPFFVPLIAGGIACGSAASGKRTLQNLLLLAVGFGAFGFLVISGPQSPISDSPVMPRTTPSTMELASGGLKAGLLTFGGAYTAIPFLRDTAVQGGWISDAQFLDAVAISSMLPSPLIMFCAFVGQLAAGFAGALIVTAAVFAPAFGFTLFGHRFFEKLIENPRVHAFLDGVASAVVGIIAWTALELTVETVRDPVAAVLFLCALFAFYAQRAVTVVPLVMIFAAAVGVALNLGI